jgi:hypothetical protein
MLERLFWHRFLRRKRSVRAADPRPGGGSNPANGRTLNAIIQIEARGSGSGLLVAV